MPTIATGFVAGIVTGIVTEIVSQIYINKKENDTNKYKEIILKSLHNYKDSTNTTYNNNITEYNFLQGQLGNCGMVASMATLARNRELYNKVVPGGQNFHINSRSNSSEFVFNLYKFGKLHKVVVNGNLPANNDRLNYCRSYNKNLVGPLLEKALIKLHFDGKYESADAVAGHNVLTSFTDNFFEQHRIINNGSRSKVDDVISHGLKNNSQMVVEFYDTISKYGLKGHHYYSLVDKKDSLVRLYNPHGNLLSVPKNIFFESLKHFEISYYNNKVFGMPEIKTNLEISDSWSALKKNENVHTKKYDMIVEVDDTKVLINLIVKLDKDVYTSCCIFSESDQKTKLTKCFINQRSVRANLKRGKYWVQVKMRDQNENGDSELPSNYLENGGNYFLFRLAASKQCLVKKRVVEEKSKMNREKVF